ncbi:MAG: ATP-binding cassette domain-containing protein [Actinomycetes bacterium]|nr:MAG: ABC transporter ATP-binding protein [Actinomycetota bacterium]
MTGLDIAVTDLSKSFGTVDAVTDLTFRAEPGRVTGFLGPNGAGKSTTLRALVGLVRPTAGTALIGGRAYHQLVRPATQVGVHLEAAFHPGRTGREHLRALAPLVGVDDARCDEALARVDLADAADRRVGGYSLGMRQRLGLATALLGAPSVLILDEAANGLDPAGIKWLRDFLRGFAAEGGTVLLSSHVLSEVEQTVDDVVIISQGRLRHQSSLAELRSQVNDYVVVRSPHGDRLADFAATRFPQSHRIVSAGEAHIVGVSAAEVGSAAFADGLELHELSTSGDSLEDVFLRLTAVQAESTSEEVAA